MAIQREHIIRRVIQKFVKHHVYTRFVKILIRHALVHEKSFKFRRDVVGAIQAWEFEKSEFADVRQFETHEELVLECIKRANPNLKDWIELGVATGNSIRLFSSIAKKLDLDPKISGFDSFEGMPEDWHGRVKKGDLNHPMPNFKNKNIRLYKGWFETSLPKFVDNELNEQIGFLHVDSDLYSSAKTAFENFKGYIRSGTVILFDEYWNYAEYSEHEFKAFREFIQENNLEFEYIGYHRHHMQAAVIIL